jgi:hypothetical protein
MHTPRLFPFTSTLHRLADDVSGEPLIGHEAEIPIASPAMSQPASKHYGAEARSAMSFCLSFHQALLGPSGAGWLDDRPDLRCQDCTRQHAVDGWLLSCMAALPGLARPTNDLHACQ